MQRIISNMILGYWLAFFAVHAAGQFGGLMFPKRRAESALFAPSGLTTNVPMTNYGLGLASIIIALLFVWTLLANAKSSVTSSRKDEIEAYAFGGAGLVISALTTLAIMHSDSSSLLSSSVYFGCLLISWTAMRQGLEPRHLADESSDTTSLTFAQRMAQGAAHHNHLAKIAGREMV
jgi:hypothetical protein